MRALLALFGVGLGLAACAGGAGPASAPAAQPRAAVLSGGTADPGALMGKPAAEVRALLGEPSLLRRDQGAEVWQYANDACVLFVYLYPDSTGAPAVSYVDARAKTSGPAPVPECLKATMKARQSGARPS